MRAAPRQCGRWTPCASATCPRPSLGWTPASWWVEASLQADFLALVDRYTPIVFAFVLGLSFLLLMLAFRSVVVPAKAVLMNLVSVGAAYGLTVLVFQKGVGADLPGFQQVEVMEAWIPIFLSALLFGLSIDYQVFLLSRICERYYETGDTAVAVSVGLCTTGKLITGAALIMAVVFPGFASGELAVFQQMGFSAAVTVCWMQPWCAQCWCPPAWRC